MNMVRLKINVPDCTDEVLARGLRNIIRRAIERKWQAYCKEGWKRDADAMNRYAQAQTAAGATGGKWPLVRAMTPMQYEMLTAIAPDGSEDWAHNPDFLKFLPKTDQFEWLKHFKLHAVDPKELGHRAVGSTPRKPEDEKTPV